MLLPNPEISKLPKSVGTLKKWIRKQMPLLPLKRAKVSLLPEKLPSMKSSQKASQPFPSDNLVFFDPPHLFVLFLSSADIRAKMYLGFAEFVDSPTQLWYSNSWTSSIRATSGQYARLSTTQLPVFPSDFVSYKCEKFDCLCLHTMPHLKRVIAVGKDYRS